MDFQEREIKFCIQDLANIEQRLQACGATLSRERVLERNLRLDTPQEDLKKGGRLLRIRQDDKVRVTYKENARVEDGVIARTEIEFETDDFEIVQKFFMALGYQVNVSYEKYRRTFSLGDVSVSLDELPFGNFVEIEGPNNILIEGVAQMLELDWSKGIPTNYLGLFETAKANAGWVFKDLTFVNFKSIVITPEELGVEPADL